MPKSLIVASDTHLSLNTWSKYPSLFGDSFFSLEQIVDLAVCNGANVLLAGDVFDVNRPNSVAYESAKKAALALAKENLKLFYVQGQHDLADPPWLSFFENTEHIHKKLVFPFYENGPVFYGLDFTYKTRLPEELSRIPENTDVFVAHQVWKELVPVPHLGKFEYSLALIHGPQMAITGDFHVHKVLSVPRGQDVLTVLSPGSTCLQSISEPVDKYVFVLNDDLTFRSEKLKTRKVISLRIRSYDDLEKSLDQAMKILDEAATEVASYPENMQKPICYVIYDDDIDRVVPSINSKYGNSSFVMFKRITKVEQSHQLKDFTDMYQLNDRKHTIIKLLQTVVDEKSLVYADCLRLLSAENISEEINKIMDDYEKSIVKLREI